MFRKTYEGRGMAAIHDNIKALREHAGYSREDLGKKIGKTRSAISQYESGKIIPRMGVIDNLATVFNVKKSEILGDTSMAIVDVEMSSFVDVPLLGSIAAGTPMEMVETEESHPVPAKVMEQYPDAKLLKVKGHSMNRILPDGCYALVDPCEEVERDNQPYAVCVNGHDATIKRVHKLENGFELVPDSTDPTFKPRLFDYGEPDTETITVIGRVVYHVLPFDWSY